VQREEDELHAALLGGDPGDDGGMGVNREIVDDDDEPAAGPSSPEALQQCEELVMAASVSHQEGHLPVRTSKPANVATTPCRRYVCSIRVGAPGRMSRRGRLLRGSAAGSFRRRK
jgi:hypothetical protein